MKMRTHRARQRLPRLAERHGIEAGDHPSCFSGKFRGPVIGIRQACDGRELFPIASSSVLAFASAASLLIIAASAMPHEQTSDPLDHLFPIIEARL